MTNEEPDGASTREVEGPKDSLFFFLFLFLWLHHIACRILVPQPGSKPAPPMAVGLRTGVDPLLVGVRTGADPDGAYLAKSIIDKITKHLYNL